MLKGEKYGNFSVFTCNLIELMKRSVSTDVRMRYAIVWDPGCSDDEIELSMMQRIHERGNLYVCVVIRLVTCPVQYRAVVSLYV